MDTDPDSRTRSPASVKTPSGPWQDIATSGAGDLAYDPGLIRAPVAIIRGEWDSLATDTDAHWLFDALKASPMKRDVKIGRATHLMHLEENRYALYHEAQTFLDEGHHQPAQRAAMRRLRSLPLNAHHWFEKIVAVWVIPARSDALDLDHAKSGVRVFAYVQDQAMRPAGE